MAQSPQAVVTPSALRWARESSGFSIDEVAKRLNVNSEKLQRAEAGDDFLTLRQAETAARMFERPLAALFVPEPPEEESPEAQFRRLPGTPEPPWPRELRTLARRIHARQIAATELYELLEEEPPWREVALRFEEEPSELAAGLRDALGVSLEEQLSWQDRSGYRPLREWIGAIEALGVLVMQDGSLPLEEMRGFAATHETVPAIVVNTNDDPRARAFTAVHELGHLLRVRAGRPTGPPTEQWCDRVASSVLMPAESFERHFRARAGSLLARIDAVALLYGVTSHAAAVRAARLRLAEQNEIDEALDEITRRRARRGEGGDWYRTQVGSLGPTFIHLVFAALDNQALTYPVASGLLRTKVNHFDTLRERAAERAASR